MMDVTGRVDQEGEKMLRFWRMKRLTSVWEVEKKYEWERKLQENHIRYQVKIRDSANRGKRRQNPAQDMYAASMFQNNVEYILYVDKDDLSRAMEMDSTF